ncbi:MAG: Rrf2 family transcriptional regulator [Alphaproteobacteria bacterium]|nr:Rrf2 family transcriptional regulator [Alphaproteobacteria bacterium]
MHLTRHTDYALRVLMYLGVRNGKLATIGEIAERYAISENHLMKVVHRLGRLGYIRTIRGRQGGILLERDPREINLGEVIRNCEDDMAVVECFDPSTNECRIAGACVFNWVLDDALGAFMAVLDRHTLGDLLSPAERIAWRLGLPSR